MSEDQFGTTDAYFGAFETLQRKGLLGKPLALLQAHFNAPNHTTTWAQLAEAVGYANGTAVNLHYGMLAKRVAHLLGVVTPPNDFWLFVLVSWAAERDPSGHTAFVLRRPVIEALARLGLVRVSEEAATADLDTIEGIQKELDSLDELDQRRVVLARREQSLLRRHLFGENEWGSCAICGSELPVVLLVAAHVKPRAKCSDMERRDYANNVVPMCVLGCDALFERGLIIVEDGRVHVRWQGKPSEKLDQFLRQLEGRSTSAWTGGCDRYFTWHAQNAVESQRR